MNQSSLLAIDLGNTNVSVGLYDYHNGTSSLTQHWRIGTHREETSDEVSLALDSLFGLSKLSKSTVGHVIISSVVPPLLPIWERACLKLFAIKPHIVGPGIRTGMPVRYDNPKEVGADRIVNSVAAYAIAQGSVIIVDFGTATTFDCVSYEGEYLGGAIFPGIHISMETLFDHASMLHRVQIARPRNVIGRTTAESLQSGLLYGYAGLVDSMVERIRVELGNNARVFATGGLAQRIADESKSIEQVEPFLTLDGLRILFEMNFMS